MILRETAGMHNMAVIEAVRHYQRSIERCSGNQERMLHCISKLYHLPVTVQHLQETGVGRTVNALRKYEGDAGDAAKALVAKWKAMVAAEESSDGEVAVESHTEAAPEPVEESYKSEKDHHHKSSRENHHREDNHQLDRVKSSQRQLEHTKKLRDDGKSNHHKSSKDERQLQKRKSKDCNNEDRGDGKRQKRDISESDLENLDDSDSGEMQIEEQNSESDMEERDSGTMLEESQESQDSSTSSSEPVSYSKRHSSHSSHHRDSHRKCEKHKEKNSHSDIKKHSKSVDNNKKSDGGNVSKGEKVKCKGGGDEHRKVDSNKHGKKSDSEKNKKDVSDKHRKDSSDRHKKESSDKYKKEEKVKPEGKKEPKEHRKEKSKSKSEVSSGDKQGANKSSKSKPSETKLKEPNEKKVKRTETAEDGSIDCFSGASFAEALGMVDPVVKKKLSTSHSTTSSGSHSSSCKKNKSKASSSTEKKLEPSTSRSSNSAANFNLLVPSVKLEPLDNIDVDIESTLPAITPHYRPLPHISVDMPSQRRGKILTEEEALSQVMSTKNQRTKVFSGVKSGKSWATVPSLYDICVRVLQENIDALEYTGGVPYDLLKPVLALATPEQLSMLEYYNPYLVEDTDELWELHCKKRFRNERREDMETSREMYMRCVDEREAKLKALTTNIQQSIIAKNTPIRKTKLAYVDSIAKPPRNVARQQAKYGTANAVSTSPIPKTAKSSTSSGAVSKARIVAPPAPRANQSVSKLKPRMAPLMQKTMKLAKSFKR